MDEYNFPYDKYPKHHIPLRNKFLNGKKWFGNHNKPFSKTEVKLKIQETSLIILARPIYSSRVGISFAEKTWFFTTETVGNYRGLGSSEFRGHTKVR